MNNESISQAPLSKGWINWIEGDARRTLNDAQRRCISAASCLHTGPYNLQIVGGWGNPRNWGETYVFLKINRPQHLQTHDFDRLTALVLNAHRYAVRIEIEPSSQSSLELRFFAREVAAEANSQQGLTHPTLEDLVQRITNLQASDEMRNA